MPGDRFYADQNSRAEIQLGSLAARIWQTTDLTITNLTDQVTQLGLAQGSIRLRTFSLNPNEQVEVDTPNGSLTVVQPGDFRVDSYTGDGGTVVTVNSGQLEVTGPNLSQYISAGQSVQLMGTNPIQIGSLQLPGLDAFDRWCIDRDHQIMNAQAGRYVSRDVVGYDDLDSYGSWMDDADYGSVWYPSSLAVDWVPYRFGHWVWVGPWGWTWVKTNRGAMRHSITGGGCSSDRAGAGCLAQSWRDRSGLRHLSPLLEALISPSVLAE